MPKAKTEYTVIETFGTEKLEDMIVQPMIEFINKQIGREVVKRYEKGDLPL